MNRVGMGLAIGAGYVLGRTKKMKLAFAIGSVVAGKKMHLSPKGVADLISGQLQNNPQFKEIGDQLREDLRGVGKAASGALVERQIDAVADRLRGRTSQVRDQLAGVTPDLGSEDSEDEEPQEEYEKPEAEDTDEGNEAEDTYEADEADEEPDEEPEPPRKQAKKTSAKKAPARKVPARKTASANKAPAGKTAAKKTTGKTTGKKTAAARGAGGGARHRPKGGGE
ncbi:hypothetical protein M2271_002386 [Streptomyces sp. LBL]|uniref:DNA primase n=1 Tax=Streptomyces sp. LBL TaxID=2940562 RepID=UPI0024756DF5|nr:DNA primase [Streptomyces sp. LBL]MDH6624582.1 hypothetical protein [Streptomyces sp. LBL]